MAILQMSSKKRKVAASTSGSQNESVLAADEYQVFKMEGVWRFFLRHITGGSGKCKTCDTILAITAGSTGALHNHLHKHRADAAVDAFLDQKAVKRTHKQQQAPEYKITEFLIEKEPFDKIVSRMAVMERIPFSRFEKSKDLRSYFHSRGYKLTHSGTQIREIIISYSNQERKEMSKNLRDMVNSGSLLSLTMDEWTSVANRRYANVNAHINGEVFNLGLWRCFGSMPAKKCKEILVKMLSAFGLGESDIVGITTDAAPVMVSMGTFYKIRS